MSGAELALGIVGAVAALDVAIKACKRVAEKYSAYAHAEAEISERSIRLLSNCLQMGRQMQIYEQMKNEFSDQSQHVQTRSFKTLAIKLDFANQELQSFLQDGGNDCEEDGSDRGVATVVPAKRKPFPRRRRANYVMRKTSLDKAIDEVETWQRLSFDPLWFETMKVQTQQFDKILKHSSSPGDKMMTATVLVRNPLKNLSTSNVFLPAQKLVSAKTTPIPYSSAKLVRVDHRWRLLDVAPNLAKDTVRELAVRLKSANPATFGLLTCLGAVHHAPHDRFSIIFRIPDNMSAPKTLRQKLMAASATGSPHSLSDRFRLATQLARAVFHIHTFDMVHKSIRPENILLFQDADSSLGSAFLLGFERVRRDADDSRRSGGVDWAQNLYRHPERQGAEIQERYIMQHDIYSLGVCLLELGLWNSFVEYTANQGLPTASKEGEGYGIGPQNAVAPETVKSRLLDLATDELPTKMGSKYAGVVEACLTCLDIGNEEFGDTEELQEEGGSVGVRYVEKVLMQLSEISV